MKCASQVWKILGLISLVVNVRAADVGFNVVNRLDLARRCEVVELDWSRVQQQLPGALPGTVTVQADGVVLPSQVIRGRDGICETLIFQAEFGPKQSRRFTLSSSDQKPASPVPVAHALFVEHGDMDYMAWENDRIAFRMYGPRCEKRLVSSGVDVWVKRVTRPILDTMSRRNYHVDNGEGVDCYTVGKGRGCGGLGIWKDGVLYGSRNFKSWNILADGPLRVVVELNYEPWDAAGIKVREVKRIILDAGSQLNRFESTLWFEGTDSVTAAVGLGLPKSAERTVRAEAGWAAVWQGTDGDDNGRLGIGMVGRSPVQASVKEMEDSVVMQLPACSGQPVVYYAGAGWSKHGFPDASAWNIYLGEFARRLASPLEIEWK